MASDPKVRPGLSFALRGRHLLLLDVVSVAVSFVLSFALRLDGPYDHFQPYLFRFLWLLLPLLAGRILLNLAFRLYQRMWQYASIAEMQAIVLSTTLGSVLFGLVVLGLSLGGPTWPAYGFPRSIIAIEWMLSTALFGATRFSLRTVQAGRWVNGRSLSLVDVPTMKRVLIVGAGDAGAMVARELKLRPGLGMDPVGFLDDDPDKHGKLIHGVQVAGEIRAMARVVRSLGANAVIVAMPSAPGRVVREILQSCKQIDVKVMTVPGLPEMISGKVTFSQIRPVQVEDLLRREPADLDTDAIGRIIGGKTVLVTGAGGSIGSELCRQILSYGPARMLLLGRGENSIYHIHNELESRQDHQVELLPLIADTRDLPRLKMLFAHHKPTVVFHAAAHKHVPLMEANPSEAVANNVFGTRNLLQIAAESGVDTFVQVSTDKAVNPANVMGATKRIAELMLQDTAAQTGKRYVAVRFGNVLGSRGSVLPLFRKQIEAGGPVTVTHPDITRFFMTIPEAVQLIIQAGAMGRGGEIFVLDMGQPIRVMELAEDVIRLSGLEPYRDIEIKVTGLRPGEKLYEELFTSSEERASTLNSRIFVSSLQPCTGVCLEDGLEQLEQLMATASFSDADIREAISHIVPEFRR